MLLCFLNGTAATEIYTLPLHDALPIYRPATTSLAPTSPRRMRSSSARRGANASHSASLSCVTRTVRSQRSEEHTSELQSRQYLVCRLLLEKKNLLVLFPSLFCLLSLHA